MVPAVGKEEEEGKQEGQVTLTRMILSPVNHAKGEQLWARHASGRENHEIKHWHEIAFCNMRTTWRSSGIHQRIRRKT